MSDVWVQRAIQIGMQNHLRGARNLGSDVQEAIKKGWSAAHVAVIAREAFRLANELWEAYGGNEKPDDNSLR